jgi:hypothetical protein
MAEAPAPPALDPDARVSDQLSGWLERDVDHTLGGLIAVFGEKSFALLFILLLGISALPIPTGGATHVFDVIAVLVAGQLVAGRSQIWIPQRWTGIEVGGGRQQRFITGLLKLIRFLERFSRPRLAFLFGQRLSNSVFGVLVILFTAGAFFAPPFSGLDTLPGLAVVLLSLGVLLEDFAVIVIALVVGVTGLFLEVVLGKAAIDGVSSLL